MIAALYYLWLGFLLGFAACLVLSRKSRRFEAWAANGSRIKLPRLPRRRKREEPETNPFRPGAVLLADAGGLSEPSVPQLHPAASMNEQLFWAMYAARFQDMQNLNTYESLWAGRVVAPAGAPRTNRTGRHMSPARELERLFEPPQ